MAMEARLSLRQSQRVVMTPLLQQAIQLLQLSTLELQEVVQKELLENPLLEEVQQETADAPDGQAAPDVPTAPPAEPLSSEAAPTPTTERQTDDLPFDLTGLAPYPAYTLSGGERRRLEITRALVTSPQYLLLDEPFTGIDPIAIGDIQEIVGRLKERGIGILITDHNVRETLAITDRAYILYDGKILVSGTATEIANNPIAREIYLGEKFAL